MPIINETQTIQSDDFVSGDLFGTVAISSDGTTAIVGARTADSPLADAGAAYIFINTDGVWSEQAKLVASDQAAVDYFGFSVSISADGNTAIVGAVYEDNPLAQAGSAYVFTRSGTTWSEQAKLVASDAATNNQFGYSVAISGDGNTAIVGAIYGDGAFQSGTAYVFTRSGTTWSELTELVPSDGAGGDFFGYSAAISDDGNTAIVGAIYDDTVESDSGSAYIFINTGGVWSEQAKLVASTETASGLYGCSVAISDDGNTAIVGASEYDNLANVAGAAYIYVRSGTTWSIQSTITASDGVSLDRFGYSVDISSSGDVAVIGAILHNETGPSAGSAYIFTRSGTTWTEQSELITSDATSYAFGRHVSISGDGTIAIVGDSSSSQSAYIFSTGIVPTINEFAKLVASDQADSDQFGWSVAISGDGLTAVVGAKFDNSPLSDAGSAYVYINSGGTWSEQAKLVASDQAASDWFGYSVAISEDGNTIAVGAPYDDSPTVNAGSTYIFVRSGTSWSEQQKLTDTVQAVNDRYGFSVGLSSDGNTVIVGAFADSSPAYQSGSAFVYTRSGVTWTLEQKLVASDQVAGDQFGWSVSISGDGTTAIIGANYDYSPAYQAGSAYIFVRSGVTWTQQQKLTASDQAADDQFGHSVDISEDGNTVIIGAIGDDSPLNGAGSAYIFTRSGVTWTQEAKLVASDQAGGDLFGQSVTISGDGNTAVIGAYGDDSPLTDAGSAYVFTRSGTTWSEADKLLASDQAGSDNLGFSVCISSDATTVIAGAYGDNSPLTDAGSAYIFSTGITPPATGVEGTILALSPIGYWKLNDAHNAAVVDYSGNGYDGVWYDVDVTEATQDDMLGDGVLGMKTSLAGSPAGQGYHENTAIMAEGSTDTGTYTYIGWFKPYSTGTTDVVELMEWYTTQSTSHRDRGALSLAAEFNGKVGYLSWWRKYQSGTDPENDYYSQWKIGTTPAINDQTPYLLALRETPTLTEALINGVLCFSIPRVGMSSLDTTYAPREGIRMGAGSKSATVDTATSHVHSALFNYALTDGQILDIYTSYFALSATGTMDCQQAGQTGTGAASQTGTLTGSGTIVSYQEDAFLVDQYGVVTEFISQSSSVAAVYTNPDNYIVSNQIPQGVVINATATSNPQVYRYSTGGITTTPDSTPANTAIAPRLVNPGNYKGDIDLQDVGVVTPSFGQITLDNRDGGLDGLIDKSFDGGSYKLYYGPKGGVFPDDFVKVVDTVMGKPTFDHKTIKVQLRDKLDFLSLPLSDQSYTGLGGSGGDSTIKGATKNRVIGRVWGAPVQPIDVQKLVYFVCLDRMSSDNTTNNFNSNLDNSYRSTPKEWNAIYNPLAYGRVFDGGTQLTNEADYMTEADLFALQPSPGCVRWYRPVNGIVMFRLGSTPDKDVRVDVETSPSGATPWYVSSLVSERGDIDIASGSLDVSIDRGFFAEGADVTYADAIREFLKKGYHYARVNKDGEFTVGQIRVPMPSDTSIYEFTESNISGISIEQAIPAWKVLIKAGATSSSQTNTGIDEARRAEFTDSGYHTESSYEAPSIKSRHKLSEIINTEVLSWWNQDDIDEYTENTRAFLMEDRIVIQIAIGKGLMNSETLMLDIGDIVSVKMPRYNFDLGKKFYIHGVRHDYGTGTLNFTLWG